MALIKCPECGKEISDRAECCPECGFKQPPMKKSVNKKALGIGLGVLVIIVVVIFGVRMVTKISTDSNLSESMIGKDRDFIEVLMRKESNSLKESDDYDSFKEQEFFGMSCELNYYYDDDNKVKQITYLKWIDQGKEKVEDYQKNIDAIVDYYSNECNNTKSNEGERVDYDSDFYEYKWWNSSKSYMYSLEVRDDQISMTLF